MTQLDINIGAANGKQGDTLFDAFTKTQSNFSELYGLAINANNIVIVNSVEDFPAPSGGVITLQDNITYQIGGNVSTSDRFQCGLNNVITCNNPFANVLIYTGVGTMFTGVNVSFLIERGVISCPNAQAFDFSATAGNSPTFGLSLTTIVSCQKCGTLDNLRSINTSNVGFFDCTDGFTIKGVDNWDTITVSRLRIPFS